MSVQRQGPDEPARLSRRSRRRRVVRWTLRGLLFLVLVARRVTASGYVTTEDYAEVRAPIAGTVAEILRGSGDEVVEGEVLMRLNDRQEQATYQEALSEERRVAAEISRLETEVAELERKRAADIEIARLRLNHATVSRNRVRELAELGLASQHQVEDAVLAAELARVSLAALEEEHFVVYEKRLAVLREELQAKREASQRALARLEERAVRAPIGGVLIRYEFVVGEMTRPDTVLYEIFGGERPILKLRVQEQHASLIEVGQDYRARLKSYGGIVPVWFHGRVEALRGVIQTSERTTYRTVYCDFDPGDYEVPPGTTAEAEIHVGRSPLWKMLIGEF